MSIPVCTVPIRKRKRSAGSSKEPGPRIGKEQTARCFWRNIFRSGLPSGAPRRICRRHCSACLPNAQEFISILRAAIRSFSRNNGSAFTANGTALWNSVSRSGEVGAMHFPVFSWRKIRIASVWKRNAGKICCWNGYNKLRTGEKRRLRMSNRHPVFSPKINGRNRNPLPAFYYFANIQVFLVHMLSLSLLFLFPLSGFPGGFDQFLCFRG